MAAKVSYKLIALSSTIITAIYGAGYHVTARDAGEFPAAFKSEINPFAIGSALASIGQYRDGLYRGSGEGKFGEMEVEITIEDGVITSARITGFTTSFPTSVIAELPGQVLVSHGAEIDVVGGATASSQAFRGAVAEALRKAVLGEPAVPRPPAPVAPPPFYNYKDGVYVDQEQAFVSVRTELEIIDGKIVAAEITLLSQRNPYRFILRHLYNRAAEQVIERQSSDFDIVTGATGSMLRAQMSVEAALAQARR